jgi:carboxypeptidase C (cathepsin A)
MPTSRFIALLILAAALPATTPAQQRRQPQRGAEPQRDSTAKPAPNAEASPSDDKVQRVVTQHSVVIGGQRIDYDATVGDIILRDSVDEPIGALYFTAYTRRGVTDPSRRPITFAYNGGPGSSSVWVHMGAFGPKRVVTPDTTHAPPPPYQLVDNAYSPLDKTDLVFIDPIGTGFSHPLGKATGKMFWGVDEDARSLGQFVSRYLTEQDRWNSPRYQ